MKNHLPGCGRSKRSPYVHGEPADARHARRLRLALEDEPRFRQQIAALQPSIIMHNHGGHWHVTVCADVVVQWWPETGRVIVGTDWNKPRKAHDVDQLAKIIRKVARW